MAVSMLDNISYLGRKNDTVRSQFNTIEEMKNFNPNYLSDMYISCCLEDGCVYVYNISNPETTDTGKWKKIGSGGSADLIDYFTKSEITALLEGYVEKENGKTLSTNDYTTLEKEKLDLLENYDDTEVRTHITTSEQAITDIQTSIGNTPLTTTEQSLTGAIVEIKNACDANNASLDTRVKANENAIAIINGDSTVSGSIKKASANVLKDSKSYVDQKISEMSTNSAINCDQKPTYFDAGGGTITITYIKDGTPMTTDDLNTWFYYTQNDKLMQTIFIKDSVDGTITENSVVSAGETNFNDFVSKSKDIVDTYTGDEADLTKVGNLGALQALEQKVNTSINERVKTADIYVGVDSSSDTIPLAASQGKVLDEKINTKLDKTFTGDDVANKHLITDSLGNVALGTYDDTISDTSTNAVQNKAIKTELDKKFDIAQSVDKAGYVAVIGEDGNMTFTEPTTLGGNADIVSYENDDYPELTNVALALNSLLDKVNYLEPELTSFTISPPIETYEIGSEITDLQFSWTYNKEIKSQALTDCTIVADDRSAVYPSTLSATKTFTLTFSDGQTVKVGSKKISFLPKIYYGCCPEAEYNSEFVLALSDSVLASNPKRDYAFNCGVGEFAYIVCPTSQNFKGDIWVNGFQATMEKVSTISVTNASNYTQSYDVWRFSNDGLGSFVGTVK